MTTNLSTLGTRSTNDYKLVHRGHLEGRGNPKYAQVLFKQSFAFAKENDMLSPILERMIQKSFEAGKYIRSNTHIGKGAVSISYAIVEKLSKLPQINSSKILVVGAGETSLLTIKHLLKKQIENICVVNRSSDKSKRLTLVTM